MGQIDIAFELDIDDMPETEAMEAGASSETTSSYLSNPYHCI